MTAPLHLSPVCFVNGKVTCTGAACRALVPPPSPSPPHPDAQHPDVWYSPHFDFMHGVTPPPDFFPLLTNPMTAWPQLASRTSTLKLKMSALFPSVTSEDLLDLVRTVHARGMRVGLEIGGARWGMTRCDAASQLLYAKREQKQARRWLDLGGRLDSITTDHACTWDVRHELSQQHCVPRVSMATRIDAVAQVLASWREFLGPNLSIGFIESLGYWDIVGPDGTEYRNTDPQRLDNLTGWTRSLENVTALLLSAARKHNPTPEVPLIDHYQIDYGMDGVEQDTLHYGARAPAGMNYGRILGAEAVMKAHGLETGVILNANAAHMRTYAPVAPGCLVACSPTFTPSHSASLRTLNVTRGYLQLPSRGSQHAILEQWQTFPNVTGPETAMDTGMWMASQAAGMLKPRSDHRG